MEPIDRPASDLLLSLMRYKAWADADLLRTVQVLTRSEILLHVSLHGAGHRGNVSLLLRKLGAEPPPDRFTSYLRQCSAAPEPSAALSR